MALTKIDDRGLKTPIDLLDNEKIRLGTGNDLELFHDGSHSVIQETGTGDLEICTNTRIMLQKDRSEVLAKFIPDGAVELYHDNTLKFGTDSAGVYARGDLMLNYADNYKIKLGAGNDLQIYHDGSQSYVANSTGNLNISSGAAITLKTNTSEAAVICNNNGSVDLYHDNSKTFETTSAGATITRDLTLNHASGDTALRWAVGGTNKFSLYESSGTLRFYDNTNNAERVRIDSSGKFAIGNTIPSSFDSYANDLVIGTTSGNHGMTIVGGTASHSSIYFADGTSGGAEKNPGIVDYNHSTNKMRFATSASDAMVIDSSGDVGIGTTSPAGSNALFGGTQKTLMVAGSAAPMVRIASDTSNQADLILQAGNSGADAHIANAASNGDLVFSTHNGSSQGTRLRILDDGGICFNSDTAAANALNDYEEGAWTPSWTPASGSYTALYYSGAYTKIGNVVTCTAAMSINGSSNPSGEVHIGGLPFSVSSLNSSWSGKGGGGVARWWYAGPNHYCFLITTTSETIRVHKADGTFLNASNLSTGYNQSQLSFVITYLTDD